METQVTSSTREVIIGGDRPTVLIGERINPSGNKRLADTLRRGNLEAVRSEALAQVQAKADILDVNVGTFGVDEVTWLPQAVRAVTETVDVPLCLDSTNPQALEAALKVYHGKPIINSVTGEEHSLASILALAKEYGAVVIGLIQDDEGIPKNAEKRVSTAYKIVERAESAGIPRENIIIDCLTLATSADAISGTAIIEASRQIKHELGVNLVLAVSNVSFGLPERILLNNAFATMAIAAGVTCLIADVSKIRPTVLAADLILGRDKRARHYIEAYRQRQHPL